MSEQISESLPPKPSPTLSVRRVRLGLRTKLFAAFTVVMMGYAFLSSTYLLNYFFNDKARYVLFSLHQSAEAACAKLSAAQLNSPADMGLMLRQNDTASGFVYNAVSGDVLAEHRLDQSPSDSKIAASSLWTIVSARASGEKLSNFTFEHKVDGQRLFLSACRVDRADSSLWLLFAADANQALSPAKGLLVNMGGLFVVLLLAGFGVFFLIARGLTQPLQSLTAIADDLGAGNYHNKINVKGSDELGVLADSFTILSQRLDARETELEKTTELANQDFLTQVWNRRYMDRRLQEYLSLARRHGHDLSLVYLDADHFKKINDTYGHPAGDEVLKNFAAIMKKQLRETDLVARVGGEEFVLVLPETGIAGALQAATKLREAIKAFDFLGEKRIKMTASFGVMALNEDSGISNSQQLIAAADAFAYQSKTGGRDRISSPLGQIV